MNLRKRTSSFKSTGLDKIFPLDVYSVGDKLTEALCLRFAYVPKKYRFEKVVFLAKPGTINYSQASPMSITSF